MASSFEIRNVRYESIHDVSTEHWTWFFDAACPEDGDVILDCGCGYAACTRELLERFTNESFIIDLVDESDFQLERAKKELEQLSRANVQIQYIKSGVGKNWNPSRKYHKIFLKMVLHEHPLAEQSVILNAIYDLLRPGGILILWDISLNSDIADFFRSVIRKKDELLGFDSLVQRRHFATKEEIICNVAKSKFKTLELIRQFHCKCYSDRRIQDEFKNDMEKYQLWITEIDLLYSQLGTKAKKELSFKRYFNHPDAMQTPVVDDNGDHRLFTIDRSIWCLQRADKLSLINRKIGIKSIQTHLAPSARRSDLPEIFLNAVKEGLIVLNDHKLLNNHHGLIRVTTFEVGDKGKRMLKPEGFDYIYDFRELAHSNYFVSQLADAYFRHMFNIYNNKYIHKETGWTTLTEYLNKRGSRTNECSWLRILVAKGDQPQELEIRVTLCIGEIETLSDIFDINIEKFQSVKDDIHKIEPPINTSNTNSGSYRLEYKGESVDSIATTKVNDSHFFSTDQALYPDLNVNIGRWRNETFSDLPYEALVNFAVFYFDARLGCGYYILPPAPLTNSDHRSEEVAIFFSSDSKLSTVEENLLLAFTSKIWGDLRGVESFC
jgi:SAM-dependent methyltransferase